MLKASPTAVSFLAAPLSVTAAINGKSVENTALYTVPTGKKAVVTGYVVRCTAAAAISIGASGGIGNIAGTSNISAAQDMTALLAPANTFQQPIMGASLITSAGEIIYFNLTGAATGTSQTLAVDLIGYLI